MAAHLLGMALRWGTWILESPTMPINMRDVARVAGVSQATVSNVLNGLPTVTEKNRKKVLDAVRATGFVRNESARQLKAGRSRTLGLILEDAENPFFTAVALGVEEVAARAGYAVFTCNVNRIAGRERSYLRVLEEERVGGIVVLCEKIDGELAASLVAIQDRGAPVAVIGLHLPDSPFISVTGDNVEGGYLATRHLLSQGHTRIGFITGPLSLEGFADRLAGARRAIAEASDDRIELLIIEQADQTIESGSDAAYRLIRSDRPPTAIFGANDLMALGALQAAIRLSIPVPQSLAVVGYDDIPFASGATVPLSSVGQQSDEFGREATRMLLSAIRGEPDGPSSRRYSPSLIVRASSSSSAFDSWIARDTARHDR